MKEKPGIYLIMVIVDGIPHFYVRMTTRPIAERLNDHFKEMKSTPRPHRYGGTGSWRIRSGMKAARPTTARSLCLILRPNPRSFFGLRSGTCAEGDLGCPTSGLWNALSAAQLLYSSQ